MILNITVSALKPGDRLIATDRVVLDVALDGLYERKPDNTWRRGVPFPKGKAGIILDDGQGVRYWWKRTAVQVERA